MNELQRNPLFQKRALSSLGIDGSPKLSPIKRPLDQLEKKELLGKGSFGSVYRCLLSVDSPGPAKKVEVAVKVINFSGDMEENDIGRELYFLKTLKSPFIVNYYNSFIYHGELYIVMVSYHHTLSSPL